MKEIAFEIIGNIMVVRNVTDIKAIREFAKVKMEKHPYIKTVLQQTTKIQGQERKRDFNYIMGEKTFETVHNEYGNSYFVDLSNTFFSPRLSYERQRIAQLVKKGEIVLNFFSGVGPFSIAIAKKQPDCVVHSIEINQAAYQLMVKNIENNNCKTIVFPYLGDAFEIVKERFINTASRILLPLPLESDKSLPVGYDALKNHQGIIHWQITVHKDSKDISSQDIEKRVRGILENNHITTEFSIETLRIIRWIAPRIAHLGVDLRFFDRD
ncbi:MAG: class I SAM-dependent methyltransferase [Candidatus Heimdallarchaeaceae archaeon]|jgi:tRNA (guanine37-N1)-methyltransferase